MGAARGHGEPDGAAARVVVAVASGKGGVGKSTVALNVAVSLAERGLRVGSIWALGVERLGTVPLDPRLGRSSAAGRPVVVDDAGSGQARALRAVVAKLHDLLG